MMAKNTTHKYWFFVSLDDLSHDWFYIAVPMKDRDALALIARVQSALGALFIRAYVVGFPHKKAYQDIRKGISVKSLEYALMGLKEVLQRFYTKDALDIIFNGF